jgi:hypothetical protein
MEKRYVIGLDFGTKSGRALVVNAKTGETAGEAVKDYDHGVMDRFLPDGKTALDADWALQYPQDYLDTLEYTVREAVSLAGIAAGDIIGLSIDFTACTILPIDAAYTPLCLLEQYKNRPHAYVKLWKHHAALSQTRRINEILTEKGLIDLPLRNFLPIPRSDSGTPSQRGKRFVRDFYRGFYVFIAQSVVYKMVVVVCNIDAAFNHFGNPSLVQHERRGAVYVVIGKAQVKQRGSAAYMEAVSVLLCRFNQAVLQPCAFFQKQFG